KPASPVTVPPWHSTSIDDAASVMRWHAVTRSAPPLGAPGAVVGFGEVDWALPAMLHAHATERPFRWFDDPAELIDTAAHSTGPLTVCAPPERLTRQVQDGLAGTLSFTVPEPAVSAIAFPARPL